MPDEDWGGLWLKIAQSSYSQQAQFNENEVK